MATVQEEIQEAERVREREELDLVLNVLPPGVAEVLRARDDLDHLLEVVLDLGRLPEARFVSGDADLDESPVTSADLENVIERVGDFGDDNRAGIERTLHRISAIRQPTIFPSTFRTVSLRRVWAGSWESSH